MIARVASLATLMAVSGSVPPSPQRAAAPAAMLNGSIPLAPTLLPASALVPVPLLAPALAPQTGAAAALLQTGAAVAAAKPAALFGLVGGMYDGSRAVLSAPSAPDAPLAAPDPSPSRYGFRNIPFYHHFFPSVAFRPDRPVEALIVQAIDAARESIDIALYEFKSPEILAALRRARKNNVRVRIVADYDNMFPRQREGKTKPAQRSPELQALIDEGFDVQILRGMHKFGINHNKFMIFDQRIAEFGSYNYTKTSEQNHFENVKFTDDPSHINAFVSYWQYMRTLSVPFAEAQTRVWPTEVTAPPREAAPSVEFNEQFFPAWHFSPDPAGEDHLVRLLGAARVSIDISMFSFRSTRVAQAILAAQERGVRVRVLFDKSQAEGPNTKLYADWLASKGVTVAILAGPNPGGNPYHEKNHNKIVIVDGRAVETGSMNWSKNAVIMNFENMHFTTDAVDVLAYSLYFNDTWALATPYARPAAEPTLPTDAELVDELLIKPAP